jgi:hypothetical protein
VQTTSPSTMHIRKTPAVNDIAGKLIPVSTTPLLKIVLLPSLGHQPTNGTHPQHTQRRSIYLPAPARCGCILQHAGQMSQAACMCLPA